MRVLLPILALCALLAGCGPYIPPDTARMPMVAGRPVVTEAQAVDLFTYNLGYPATTYGNPALGARAVAATDWLAGQTSMVGDYGSYAPVYRVAWRPLRDQVRATLGIAPGTPSQEVVDRLFAASAALQRGDMPGAEAALQSPAFTLGPMRTIAVLGNLPPFPGWAQAHADLFWALHPDTRCTLPLNC